MQLKFSQVAIGQGFRFGESDWIKIGPLTAQSPQGQQRLIPRSALVKPIAPGESVDIQPPVSGELRREVVEKSLAKLSECTEALIGGLERGEIDAHTARERFRACYAAERSALDTSPD